MAKNIKQKPWKLSTDSLRNALQKLETLRGPEDILYLQNVESAAYQLFLRNNNDNYTYGRCKNLY